MCNGVCTSVEPRIKNDQLNGRPCPAVYTLALGCVLGLTVFRYLPRVLERRAGIDSQSLQMVLTRLTCMAICVAAAGRAGIYFGVPLGAVQSVAGVGALAFSLASKEIVQNLIGGFILSIMRPFDVGEQIFLISNSDFRGSTDPHVAEYNVINMGWYQTILIAKDTKPVVVPNRYFLSHNVINISRQTHRVLVLDFRIRYQDRHMVYDLVADFEKYLRSNPDVDAINHPTRVNVTANNPDHLVLNVEAHVVKVDLTTHYKVKTRILMDLMDLMERRTGYGGALPTAVRRLEGGPLVTGAGEAGHAGETFEEQQVEVGFVPMNSPLSQGSR